MERADIMQIFDTAYKRGIQDSLDLINRYCHFDAKTVPDLIVMINQSKMETTHE